MSATVGPSPDEECCSCHSPDVLLNKFESGFGEHRREHQHCDICYTTLIGNTCCYSTVRPEGPIVQAFAACTNIILKAIRESK